MHMGTSETRYPLPFWFGFASLRSAQASFARAQRTRASHMPEPKRADSFPPAVAQCIAMGSSMESVHTAMSPSHATLNLEVC